MFGLAASSIACLLCDFYQLCPMRAFTLAIFLPALVVLAVLAAADRLKGDRQLWHRRRTLRRRRQRRTLRRR